MEVIEAGVLEQTLSDILVRLANFFGTTVEVVSANAPEWLAKYGWYVTLSGIGNNFCGYFLIAISAVIMLLLVQLFSEKDICNMKSIVIVFIGIFILTSVIGTIIYCLPAIVAPEIVGLERLIAIIR